MIKCPFCHHENEDGTQFCERCTSDLAGVAAEAPVAMAAPVEEAPIAMAVEAPPMAAEAVPMAGEAPIPLADDVPVAAEAAPIAEAEPVTEPLTPAAALATPAPVAEAPPAPLTVSDAASSTMPAPAPAPAEAAPAAPAAALPAGAQPRLIVQRGQKRNVEFPIYEGQNFIGRSDEKPVDIDLEDQEPPDRVWSSRQHAVITYENGSISIEDLNSSNGTFVNRGRLYPGQPKQLSPNDVIQIGTVQLKLLV